VSLDPEDFENHGYVNNVTPGSAQLVEFVAPTNLEDLPRYQWPGPPVDRVLADMTGEGTFTVDLAGVRGLPHLASAERRRVRPPGFVRRRGGGAVPAGVVGDTRPTVPASQAVPP
jgi:hypothetical protein